MELSLTFAADVDLVQFAVIRVSIKKITAINYLYELEFAALSVTVFQQP